MQDSSVWWGEDMRDSWMESMNEAGRRNDAINIFFYGAKYIQRDYELAELSQGRNSS